MADCERFPEQPWRIDHDGHKKNKKIKNKKVKK